MVIGRPAQDVWREGGTRSQKHKRFTVTQSGESEFPGRVGDRELVETRTTRWTGSRRTRNLQLTTLGFGVKVHPYSGNGLRPQAHPDFRGSPGARVGTYPSLGPLDRTHLCPLIHDPDSDIKTKKVGWATPSKSVEPRPMWSPEW